MTVKDYSTTASSNTAINGININTGMPPSNVDNALRQYGKDIRDVWNDKEWFILGDGDGSTTFNRTSAMSVNVAMIITDFPPPPLLLPFIGSQSIFTIQRQMFM